MRKTPAHAGQTDSSSPTGLLTGEDPCACRADMSSAGLSGGWKGRPLRMQGRLTRLIYDYSQQRKTPAHAGQTSPPSQASRGHPEDPCACRADPPHTNAPQATLGRPLRMQGRHGRARTGGFRSRKTPAHAGQTFVLLDQPGFLGEDPCACRADSSSAGTTSASGGRPLRMQGRPDRSVSPPPPVRKTPAHAGQTLAVNLLEIIPF